MTIISNREYSKSPAKYIQRAKEGERVIISSKGAYVELNPLSLDDKDVAEYTAAKCFLTVSSAANKESAGNEVLRFATIEELRAHLASL